VYNVSEVVLIGDDWRDGIAVKNRWQRTNKYRLKCTGWTKKHSLISGSYKIKTYWNILTKLVATVA